MENKYNFIQKIRERDFKRVSNIAGNILLRPNDTITMMGEERFLALKEAFETVLEEDYKGTDLYNYYYSYNKEIMGFCEFNRWLAWYKTA